MQNSHSKAPSQVLWVPGVNSLEEVLSSRNSHQSFQNPIVAIGNFDGVHLGHQDLLKDAVHLAKDHKGVAVAYTFRPHPRVVLKPESAPRLLLTYEERLRAFGALGMTLVVEEPFSRSFSNLKPQEFFKKYLLEALKPRAITVGYDFAFGKDREGSLEQLSHLCRDSQVQLQIKDAFKLEDEVVSSSQIRRCLESGNIEKVNHLLGYSYFYEGPVIRGDQRGRLLGFPTANLAGDRKMTPALGVYATLTQIGEARFHSVTNVGMRPTFEKKEKTYQSAVVETHILGQDMDLYGKTLRVEFIKSIRSEQKFPDISALKAQIEKDVRVTRDLNLDLTRRCFF